MEKFLCNTCNFNGFPECVMYNIIDSVSLDDIINNHDLKKTPYLVCKSNAQLIENGKMNIKTNCNHCNLCKYICKFKNSDYSVDEKLLINDIPRLNIYLDTFLKSLQVATEVKANGNFRNKRLDLVVRHNKNIILIKVLTNIDKYGFYMRSYTQVVKEYSETYPEYHFSFKCLVDSSFYNKYNNSDFEKIVTINKLIEELKGV